MKKSTAQILKLFFNPGEEICISPNKYAYHSVSQECLTGTITLNSPNISIPPLLIEEKDINMIAINPINGFRSDDSVTAYRSFLIEIDDGPLSQQKKYVESMKMPYSICVFSGNKSLHYGIVLDRDLPDYTLWKQYSEWILNIMSKADPLTKNPSRSIRFPENQRNDGKKLIQKLIDIRERVSLDDLNLWLSRYPECKPISPKKHTIPSMINCEYDIPEWIYDELRGGIDNLRNNTWFKIAGTLAKKNFMEEEIINFLEPYFTEEPDFRYREWISAIKNGIERSNNELD